MNSSFGDTVSQNIDYKHDFKTESWMETVYDDKCSKKNTNCKMHIILNTIKMKEEKSTTKIPIILE